MCVTTPCDVSKRTADFAFCGNFFKFESLTFRKHTLFSPPGVSKRTDGLADSLSTSADSKVKSLTFKLFQVYSFFFPRCLKKDHGLSGLADLPNEKFIANICVRGLPCGNARTQIESRILRKILYT